MRTNFQTEVIYRMNTKRTDTVSNKQDMGSQGRVYTYMLYHSVTRRKVKQLG